MYCKNWDGAHKSTRLLSKGGSCACAYALKFSPADAMQTHAWHHAGEDGGKREAFSHRRVQNRPSADCSPLAARCKGVWGSREWALLDSFFAIVFFIRPSLVKIYQKYLTGFMGHCGPRPFNVENKNALRPNLSSCSYFFIRSFS